MKLTHILSETYISKEELRYELRNQKQELLAIWTCKRAPKRRIPWLLRVFLFFFWLILWMIGLFLGGDADIEFGEGRKRRVESGELTWQKGARTLVLRKNTILEGEKEIGRVETIRRFKAFQPGQPYQLILHGEKALQLEPISRRGKGKSYELRAGEQVHATVGWQRMRKHLQISFFEVKPDADLETLLLGIWPLLRAR